ncbi:TPA: transposase [Legionella pneumophila]|nr:transposase [Legionella pneumophila]HBD7173654.1 transposase [Legionella pneumophila]HCU5989938.1 transposase [Legionella pneumophila]HDP7979107.1 transposase [Legionella pneumophila]HEM6948550.1 transposase [Legionella pneumophila]
MTGKELPKVIDKSQADIDAAINAIQSSDISPATKDFAISCIRLAVWLPRALLEQKIKLSNLRKLIFGQGKRNRSKPDKGGSDNPPTEKAEPEPLANDPEAAPIEPAATEPSTPVNCAKRQGHGRLPHSAYTNAIEHSLAIADFNIGDLCPENCGGKLYRYEPGVLVRVKGQNLAAVHKYWVEKLRCVTCGYLVTADVPDDVGTEKYDATFKSALALQKYYVAVPFNRQSYFQSLLQMPLPVSTQWHLIEEVGSVAIPVFHALERVAANGKIVHNDDSHVKITDLIHLNRKEPSKERTGMFTTGILSRTGEHDIALFYNGTQHAGENLEKLLKKRDPNNPPIIQMCDALSRNIPASFKTILCNCLSHGLRKFDDLKDFYPEPCLHIIKQIADVYEYDEKTKVMDKEARLSFHQEHSESIMKSLKEYIANQLETKQVEPNDSLGTAMRYMLKHWHELTQFLRVPGAPLDNNILERALKIPIRGRRTWLFYKTQYGAMIGGVLTSVIYTCALAGINPLTYLTALQENKNQVVKEPERWLPWNYQDNLTTVLASAA